MDKHIEEIDKRIKYCLDAEEKLNHIDSLLDEDKISNLEHKVFKQNILKNRSEDEFKDEINSYIAKAVSLKNKIKRDFIFEEFKLGFAMILFIFILFLFIHEPTSTGLITYDAENNSIFAELIIDNISAENISSETTIKLQKNPIKENILIYPH